jgi:hypothetical protein
MGLIDRIRFLFDNRLIYVAAMPRSGSTFLAGMLSHGDESLILREPGYARGLFNNDQQFEQFDEIDLTLMTSCLNAPHGMLKVFKEEVYTKLKKRFGVVGVKECFHQNWNIYESYGFDVKYVTIVRDPRDIMLSTIEYGEQLEWHKEMWADRSDEYIAEKHNESWSYIKEIIETRDTFKVRYEDLCTGKVDLEKLYGFCGIKCVTPKVDAGVFTSHSRGWEVDRHGVSLSDRTVLRWREESDAVNLSRAHNMYRLMDDYSSYWDY